MHKPIEVAPKRPYTLPDFASPMHFSAVWSVLRALARVFSRSPASVVAVFTRCVGLVSRGTSRGVAASMSARSSEASVQERHWRFRVSCDVAHEQSTWQHAVAPAHDARTRIGAIMQPVRLTAIAECAEPAMLMMPVPKRVEDSSVPNGLSPAELYNLSIVRLRSELTAATLADPTTRSGS